MGTPDASPCKTKREEEEEGSLSPDDGLDDEMDPATRQALTDMDVCQKELKKLNEKASDEILQVENKYNKIRKPYYDKREGIIEKIPNFWVTAIINNPEISKLVDEDEQDCLHFLKKVEVVEFENAEDGFKIIFTFDENPFFENLELVKELQFGPKTEPKSTSTTIKWKEGMNISEKKGQLIDARKKRGLKQKTFFSWFSDNQDPDDDEIAEVIKDDLWPNPLQYYLASDMEDSDSYDYEDEESMDSDDDMLDEEDDQSSDEENDAVGGNGEDGEENVAVGNGEDVEAVENHGRVDDK